MIKNVPNSNEDYEKVYDSEDIRESDVESQTKNKDSKSKFIDKSLYNKNSVSQKDKLRSPFMNYPTRNRNIFQDYIENTEVEIQDTKQDRNFVLFFPDFYDIDLL